MFKIAGRITQNQSKFIQFFKRDKVDINRFRSHKRYPDDSKTKKIMLLKTTLISQDNS